ncbi:secretin N-terminal domain-containing protein [Pseudaquabacterium pictum]|uniref:Secretin/TonB short N-terminal domain-containing protein n=1 Tax=Pseudaquabacterium pictum TaxID=2315236 RepID=A0A480AMU0_9BURK|nr:secretin N-terminal domain-containing protein [Rubrivivax pictus]GCL62904.1 hypothetical protein AQPW35_19850 [Rubrivivax pictus]
MRCAAALLLAAALVGCASTPVDDAERQARSQRAEAALTARLAALDALHAQSRANLQRQAEEAQARAAAAAAATTPPPPPLPAALSAAFQKPVGLEFREATLRQVFESLARSSGVNFVFDKDVRGDAKVTVFLRQVSLDEALRVILATQQLDRKLLNDSTVLVYPNTTAKQREHQELVTRTLYLANADVRQVLTLVRTMAKTRDLHADERLNLLVVRDTPEVVRQVERLVATLDLPEPEVMLAVEVMEVASSRLDQLGLNWPSTVQYGITNATGQIELGQRGSFTASIANPALLATLRGDSGSTNLLANPSIRARNREKAKVQIGDKLPVFTTTSTANVGVSTSVSYLDVGLKLEVEPTVQLDGDVTIKVALEVSNLLREVSGPAGALAYQVGTRSSSTTLRLKDGETQVLAGLINDEDRQRAVGVPGLSAAPVVGKLFGTQSDTRNKTEVVMLITPRILRQVTPLPVALATTGSGTDSQPGAQPLRLGSSGAARVAAGSGGRGATPRQTEPSDSDAVAATAAAGPRLLLSAASQARVGETVAVTLRNDSPLQAGGTLVFDPASLQPASGGSDAGSGRVAFSLTPRGELVAVFRVLAPAAGQQLAVQLGGLRASTADGATASLAVEGTVQIDVPAADQPRSGTAP